jgi:hypothetical protein
MVRASDCIPQTLPLTYIRLHQNGKYISMTAGIVLAIVLILVAILYFCRRKSRKERQALSQPLHPPSTPRLPIHPTSAIGPSPRMSPSNTWTKQTERLQATQPFTCLAHSIFFATLAALADLTTHTDLQDGRDHTGVHLRLETRRRNSESEKLYARAAYHTYTVAD